MSAVTPLPADTYGTTLSVSWWGYDDLSSVALFDVQVKRGGLHGTWEDWLLSTRQTSADLPAEDGGLYGFRCRAIDRIGNQEEYPTAPDATTTFHFVSRGR
jgi:hypothetical protein